MTVSDSRWAKAEEAQTSVKRNATATLGMISKIAEILRLGWMLGRAVCSYRRRQGKTAFLIRIQPSRQRSRNRGVPKGVKWPFCGQIRHGAENSVSQMYTNVRNG